MEWNRTGIRDRVGPYLFALFLTILTAFLWNYGSENEESGGRGRLSRTWLVGFGCREAPGDS